MSENPYLTFEEGLYIAGGLCDLYACHECPVYDMVDECPMENFAYLTVNECYELRNKLYGWAQEHYMSFYRRFYKEHGSNPNTHKMCVLDYFPEYKEPNYCDHKEDPDLCGDCWRSKCFVKTISPLKSNDTVKP